MGVELKQPEMENSMNDIQIVTHSISRPVGCSVLFFENTGASPQLGKMVSAFEQVDSSPDWPTASLAGV